MRYSSKRKSFVEGARERFQKMILANVFTTGLLHQFDFKPITETLSNDGGVHTGRISLPPSNRKS